MTDSDLQHELGQHLREELLAGRLSRREFLRRATVFGLSAGTIAGLLAGAGGGPARAQAPPPKRGGTLRVALVPPTAAVDPVTMYDAGAIAMVQQVAEYLVWAENDLSLRPVLAQRWEPDNTGKTWMFTLREGVTFTGGRPVTADDVVATFDRLTDPQTKSAARSNFKGILSKGNIEKAGPLKVAFHLDRPFVDFPYLVSSTNYNAVVLPASYAGDFEQHPVGTGPFTLAAYAPKETASFKRNPDYRQPGLPYLDGVEFRFFAETQPQVLALEAGAVDLMVATPFQGSQALFADPNVTILLTRSSKHRAVHMRVDAAPFTDKRIRQAVALCLDRGKIVEGLFQGRADVGNDEMFAPLFPGAPAIPQRTQNYDRAKQLLREAGAGNALKISLTYEVYQEVPQYAVYLQEMLRPAGISVTLDQMTQGAYYGSGGTQPWLQVPMGITDWASRTVPSQFIGPAYTCEGVWNSAHWCDPEFDGLAKQYDATLDSGSRRATARKMALLQQDATPAIIAYWIRAPRAVQKRVRGVDASGSDFLDLTKASLA
ncbi:MAG TPA: ABC transporter substrate-binding protein [bacterium]|nr:ABC transporter substrate-binding protein [bacterium]